MISRYSRIWLWLLAAVLYGGPALSGLAQHGWTVLPVLTALCLMHASARHKPDLATPAGWAGLTMMVAEQTAMVTLLWAIGLGIAVSVTAIQLPIWAPMLVSALAAGVSTWAFRDAAEMDVMLESVLDALGRVRAADIPLATREAWPAPHPETLAALNQRLDALRSLDSWDQVTVDLIVQDLADTLGPEAFDPFYDFAAGEERANEPVIDYALLRFMMDEQVLQALIARGEAALAPMLLLVAPDPAVRGEARARLYDLLALSPAPRPLPDPVWLARLGEYFPDEGYEQLANAVDRLHQRGA
ncbi:MAG: hypothetical protein P8X50_13625 [Maritimibacter sp.]